ncbi:dihydrofolate reductase [Geodermatophilus aquaeductus]|uniref:Dihydrofolate reductase n=1 Tax=Geodermatophilus aquaeductus TaxID=1564161 RepID=A0A521FVN2_9ACTN|nr:dihydrofolate reductase [Geodermatophilus aquaeductus]SMO99651.1 dihydrofolate reductase [Geodermatophilus aquaeductus]
MTVSIVWAQAHGRVIGSGGTLPWHLPEDLRLFKQLTSGGTVVMGRRTWESLPERNRPLPGRVNVVLTTDPAWSAVGAHRAGSVGDVLAAYPDCWVIGGAAVYAAFLPHAARLVVTDVDLAVNGDTRAPVLDAGWRRVTRTPEHGWATSATGLRFAVSEYARTAAAGPGTPADGR